MISLTFVCRFQGLRDSCEGERTRFERGAFPRLIRGQLSAGFDAQRGRNDRGDRMPRFRVPDRLLDLVFYGGAFVCFSALRQPASSRCKCV